MKQYIFAVKEVSAKLSSDGRVKEETVKTRYERFFSSIENAEKFRSMLSDSIESSASELHSFSVELIELYS